MATCLLCIGLQNKFFSPSGILEDDFIATHKKEPLVDNINKIIKTIPGLKIYVVKSLYNSIIKPNKTVTIQRDNKPLNCNKLQGSHDGKQKCCNSDYASQLISEMCNITDRCHTIITKTYYSAFTNTKLLEHLTNDKIKHLIICGVTTDTCVMATVVDAYHLGFSVHVPYDCTEAKNFDIKKKALNTIDLYYGNTVRTDLLCNVFEKSYKITYFGEGDSMLIENAFEENESDDYFNSLKKSIKWTTMSHRGGDVPRLISVQHSDYPDCKPIYRHPVDVQPKSEFWNVNSKNIKNRVSALLGITLNHALVQYYRSGADYISEHADKTLDIRKNTPIINVSFGATRKMKLRSKYINEDGTRDIQHVMLKHGSVFVLGWKTNKKWLHSIKQDKRVDSVKEKDELAFNCERISLTIRDIATFIDNKTKLLFGQGSPDTTYIDDSEEMLTAFGVENKSHEYEWDDVYGKGFHCLNFDEL